MRITHWMTVLALTAYVSLFSELRSCRLWARMPMLDGEPLPDDVEFPISEYALKHHKQWQKESEEFLFFQ